MTENKTIHGWGINDTNTPTIYYIDGITKRDKIYQMWRHMIERCYGNASARRHYQNCSADERWRYLSAFRDWVNLQNIIDLNKHELDKDLLVKDNNIYSPETCLIVPSIVNKFLISRQNKDGLPIGVVLSGNKSKPFKARISNPFNGNYEYLGVFDSTESAHDAWRKQKHLYALQLASSIKCERTRDALSKRYLY